MMPDFGKVVIGSSSAWTVIDLYQPKYKGDKYGAEEEIPI